ncbi:hypothetical protein B5E82_06935 [Lachnoclostridium sp. An138]|nr:hypothetical protein B5E82_06935 [Lachnoclostridium sp. An138]
MCFFAEMWYNVARHYTAPRRWRERRSLMTCKEAEQMIMPYINDELTDKELEAFLEHVCSCGSCYEELEIYYTIYAGLAQLDGENEGQDMRNLLQEALYISEQRVRGRKLFNVFYTFSQVLAMAALTVIIVTEILNL